MRYYLVQEDKTVNFYDSPHPAELIEEDQQKLKKVESDDDFIVAENGYTYHREDVNSPEYVQAMKDLHRINEMQSLHNFLISTDYTVIKIQEAQVEGDLEEVNRLKTKYQEILAQRHRSRVRLSELEDE